MSKYGATKYDYYDTQYATRISVYFKRLPVTIQAEFQELTDNLMDEPQINRFSLLYAIKDYTKAKTEGRDYDIFREISNWKAFSDAAFNYRPYQGL